MPSLAPANRALARFVGVGEGSAPRRCLVGRGRTGVGDARGSGCHPAGPRAVEGVPAAVRVPSRWRSPPMKFSGSTPQVGAGAAAWPCSAQFARRYRPRSTRNAVAVALAVGLLFPATMLRQHRIRCGCDLGLQLLGCAPLVGIGQRAAGDTGYVVGDPHKPRDPGTPVQSAALNCAWYTKPPAEVSRCVEMAPPATLPPSRADGRKMLFKVRRIARPSLTRKWLARLCLARRD